MQRIIYKVRTIDIERTSCHSYLFSPIFTSTPFFSFITCYLFYLQNFQAKKLELEESKKERERLHRTVQETILAAEEKERGFETRRFQLENEVASRRLQLSDVEGDVRSHVSVLTSRLDEMMSQKTTAEDGLREQRQLVAEMEREGAKRTADLAKAQRFVHCS